MLRGVLHDMHVHGFTSTMPTAASTWTRAPSKSCTLKTASPCCSAVQQPPHLRSVGRQSKAQRICPTFLDARWEIGLLPIHGPFDFTLRQVAVWRHARLAQLHLQDTG